MGEMEDETGSDSGAALARRLLNRDREAVPIALNLVDDQRPDRRGEALALLARLEQAETSPGTARIGLTGSPGAGKSSLLDALVRTLRPRGETLAILAVDPSSRQTGGALLGDRIRVRSAAGDPGVFIRSMAARDHLGGLAEAARAGATILAAAFDRVLVETVGVGQSESEVSGLVDTLVYVVNPGTGDALQFMKAGILELPDIFVVNKADVGTAARRSASELESGLGLGERSDQGWTPPVLLTSARDREGIDALVDALDAHWQHLIESGGLARRRDRGRESHVVEALLRRYGSHGLERLGGPGSVVDRVRESAPASAFQLIRDLGREIEESLEKPAR
jgi:LAO/AO transport system kinase